MKKLFLTLIVFQSSLAFGGDLVLEWTGPAEKREIRLEGSTITYSAMKHGVESLKLNACSEKVLSGWEKKLAVLSRKSSSSKSCSAKLRDSIKLAVDNKVTKKTLDGCLGLTPNFSQIIGDILKCY